MCTTDLVKLHGGEPANFLDVGGSVTANEATEGFRIVLSDPKVRRILADIFHGMVTRDTIAKTQVAVAREIGLKVLVVVRLEGTNVERARG